MMHAAELVVASALYWHLIEMVARQVVPAAAVGRAAGFWHAVLALFFLSRAEVDVTAQLAMSTGYFAWELVSALRGAARGRLEPEKLAHALICGAGYAAVLQQPRGSRMAVYAVNFLWFEASTPFLHASWALHKWRRRGSALAAVFKLAFVLSFVASRVVYGGRLTREAFDEFDFRRSGAEAVCLALVAASAALNLYWLHRIVRMALRSVVGPPPGKRRD